jgi:hypothetical protein
MNDTTNTTSLRERITREADAHDYFAANPDLRMTTGDHAKRAENLRAIAALSPPALEGMPTEAMKWAFYNAKNAEPTGTDFVCTDEGWLRIYAAIQAASPVAAQAVTAYLAENANEAYVFFANDHESLDAYTADGFAITPLVRHHRTQAAEHPFAHPNAAPCDAQGVES